MAILRRTSGEVYRVYSKEAYLDGADEFGEWHASPVKESAHERRLRRLGGAAALTGAVGAVGGVIVFVGMGARVPNRQVASNATRATRGVPLRAGEVVPETAVRQMRARQTGGLPHAGAVAWRRAVGRSSDRRSTVSANSARSAVPRRVAGHAPSAPTGLTVTTRAVAYDAAQDVPVEVAARSPTQSEFGFER
jgi:hypothetical protein